MPTPCVEHTRTILTRRRREATSAGHAVASRLLSTPTVVLKRRGSGSPSYSDRTGPAVRPLKDRTRAYNGLVHLKDRMCNRTAINRLNRPVFYGTGEPAGSM